MRGRRPKCLSVVFTRFARAGVLRVAQDDQQKQEQRHDSTTPLKPKTGLNGAPATCKLAPMNSQSKPVAVLLAIFFAVSAWSVYRPHDYFTWFLEVVPALIALAVLTATYPRFQFTTPVYCIILLHAIVLFVGGHYTYAQVPIGNWFRDHFHLSRNHFDRLGHFLQGFTPALVSREVLLRRRIVLQDNVRRGGWLAFIVFSISMMVTALYELLDRKSTRLNSSHGS